MRAPSGITVDATWGGRVKLKMRDSPGCIALALWKSKSFWRGSPGILVETKASAVISLVNEPILVTLTAKGGISPLASLDADITDWNIELLQKMIKNNDHILVYNRFKNRQNINAIIYNNIETIINKMYESLTEISIDDEYYDIINDEVKICSSFFEGQPKGGVWKRK